MNTDPGLVGVKILVLDEPHVVACDDRHGFLTRQQQTRLHTALFITAPGPDQLQVVAVAENVTPVSQPLARFIEVPDKQRMTDIAARPAGQCDETFTAFPVQPVSPDHRLATNTALDVSARDDAGQVSVAAVVLAQYDQRERPARVVLIRNLKVRADNRLDARRNCASVEFHEPEQVVPVRHGDGGHAIPGRFLHQCRDTHGAVHERVLGVDMQVHKRSSVHSSALTGEKLRRCSGHGPCSFRRARCSSVP